MWIGYLRLINLRSEYFVEFVKLIPFSFENPDPLNEYRSRRKIQFQCLHLLFFTSEIPRFSNSSNSSTNCFFALSRNFVKNFGLSFNRSTSLGQYSGRTISVVGTNRAGRGWTVGSSVRVVDSGAGDFRSETGGGWFRYCASWFVAAWSSSSSFSRRYFSSLYR